MILHRTVAATLALPSLLLGSIALGQSNGRLQPAYPLDRPRATGPGEPLQRTPIPESLEWSDVRAQTREIEPRSRASRAPRRQRRTELDAADRAAAWAAETLFRREGRREYYRVGFYLGLRAALDEPATSDVRYAGRRDGRRDFDARRLGLRDGERAALDEAHAVAGLDVESQFRELAHEPRFTPRAIVPRYDPPRLVVPEPILDDVFAEMPPTELATQRHGGSMLDGWSYGPTRLRACSAYTEFYDADWADPDAAFNEWAEDRKRAKAYHGLSDAAARENFRSNFHARFAVHQVTRYRKYGLPAYRAGFDEGWSYGVFAHDEWTYRLGYREGLLETYAHAAVAAHERTYAAAYERAYAEAFELWSTTPRPEVVGLWLDDGNGDGVFQPGEDLLARYQLVNYGGAPGRFTATLQGHVLAGPASVPVRLPARSMLADAPPIPARLDRRTPSRTVTELVLGVAGSTAAAPLTVAWPLQLSPRGIRVARDDLAGQLLVEVQVHNDSARPMSATIELATTVSPAGRDARDLTLDGRGSGSATFVVTQLEPLDLIAGNVALDVRVSAEGVVQDARGQALPGTALDLGNRDLLRHLLSLARQPHPSPSEIAEARELMLSRLRADWKAAARGRGNPYKADHRRGSRETALGDLVASYRSERKGMLHADVFEGLRADVLELSQRLGGWHPFLRKAYRRLARSLP